MRINPEDLRAFVEVTESRSFVRAAETLFITQSALSRRLFKLEEALGARLLDRSPRSIELTAIGESFLPIAREAIHGFERSLGEIRDIIEMRSGTVVVASMLTVATNVLPGIVESFSRDHPGIEVRVLDDVGPKTIAFVENGEAEFGIVLEPPDRPRLEYEPLLEDPYVLGCRRDHPLAGRRSVAWRALARYPYVRMGEWSGNQERLLSALERDAMPGGGFEVQHVAALLAFIAGGVGIGAVPSLALRFATNFDLAAVRLVQPEVSRRIGIVTVRGRTLSPAAADMRDRIAASLKSAAFGDRKRPRD